MKHVEAYVDGGCSPNPGPGAYAAILDYKGHIKEIVQRDSGTNNEMEMKAALLAIDALKERCEIHIYTDSQYLWKGMTEWFRQWRGNGWKNSKGEEVKNKDIWRRLDAATRKHKVYWHWVRGHAGHPMNDRAHNLVQEAMQTKEESYRNDQANERRKRYREGI